MHFSCSWRNTVQTGLHPRASQGLPGNAVMTFPAPFRWSQGRRGLGVEEKTGLLFMAINTERSRGLRRHEASQMGLVPQTLGLQTLSSAPWNDLQSKRRDLGWAWALWSLIPDSTPSLSSSRPKPTYLEAKAEQAGSRRASHTWGCPQLGITHVCMGAAAVWSPPPGQKYPAENNSGQTQCQQPAENVARTDKGQGALTSESLQTHRSSIHKHV